MSVDRTKIEYSVQEGVPRNYAYTTIGANLEFVRNGEKVTIKQLSNSHEIFPEGMNVKDALKLLELLKQGIEKSIEEHKKLAK